MQLKRLAPLAAAAMMSLGLVACTDDDADTDDTTTTTEADGTTTTVDDSAGVDEEALQRVVDAAQATIDEGTAAFRITAGQDDGSADTEDTTTTTEANGADDDDDGTTTTATTAGDDSETGTADDASQTLEVEIDGEVDFDADQRSLTFVGPEGDLGVIMDGSTAYIELPATEGDDWVRTDLDELLGDDVGLGGPAGLPFQDPADNLRALEGNVTTAQQDGSEQVDGEDTDRYRLVIDLEASAEDASDEVSDALQDLVERTGAQELEMWVWVDEDDLIRRVQYELDLDQVRVDEDDVDDGTNGDAGSVEADPEGTLLVTFDYSDFGLEVDIELPADEDIVDIDEEAIRDALDTGSADPGTDGGTTTTTDGSNDVDDD